MEVLPLGCNQDFAKLCRQRLQAIFVQQFLRTGEDAHLKAFDFQYELEGISDSRVIINHNHDVSTGLRYAQWVHTILLSPSCPAAQS
jgi:hypothetical protein